MAEIVRRKGDALLLAALAGGQTLRDAAKLASVSERTAGRRWSNPEFRRQVSAARAELVSCAVGQLAAAGPLAVNALRALLQAQSESVRLGACRAILELGTKLRESEELEARIAALETMEP